MSQEELLRRIEKNTRAIKKMIGKERQRTFNNPIVVGKDCPKCGAFIDERDNGCLACDFFDRLAAQDKIRD
jgi:hypothetical protein